MNAQDIAQALTCGNVNCVCGRQTGNKWMTHCPAHDDQHPSLSITERNGRVLVKCFAGCEQEKVIESLRERGLWGKSMQGNIPPVKGVTPLRRDKAESQPKEISKKMSSHKSNTAGVTGDKPVTDHLGLTLASLAEAKKLSITFLREFGLHDIRRNGQPAVRIPYMDPEGQVIGTRYRLTLNGSQRFLWKKGDKARLYGLWKLKEIREEGWVLLVEGESDCWTCWSYSIPALGIPGKTTWKREWAELISGVNTYLWVEPDAPELPAKLASDIPGLKIIHAPEGIKDLSDAHSQGMDIQALLEDLKATAIVTENLLKNQAVEQIKDLRITAAPVLQAGDPLALVKQEIRNLGYGGEPTPPIIAYLAVTSRLLAMRRGSMPVHLLLVGPPSAGKSYALGVALSLMPPEAYHTIDAGSSRVLIYDDADLRHRAVIFSEADSLPAGEDNPAASAIRNLLQEHQLRYQVTVRSPETSDYTVREIVRPGPSVLITTAIRRLGSQLDSRLFSLEVPDDPAQIQRALKTQAGLEIRGLPTPDIALIAFQSYLQALAPWEVMVPYAEPLGARIGRVITAPRITRDFARLLSLIKAVAIIRHQHRQLDRKGRIIAQIDDYQAVYELVGKMYEATVTGASEAIRQAVEAVSMLKGERRSSVTVTEAANRLGISKMAVSRRVKAAIKNGWLVNAENRRGFPADLRLGEPLPERIGLPSPQELEEQYHPSSSVTPRGLHSDGPGVPINSGVQKHCNGVTPLTDGTSPTRHRFGSNSVWWPVSDNGALLRLWYRKHQKEAARGLMAAGEILDYHLKLSMGSEEIFI